MNLEEYREYLQRMTEPKEPEQEIKMKRVRKRMIRKVYTGKKPKNESGRF